MLRETYTYSIPVPKVRSNFWFFAVIISASGMDFDCTQKCNNISEAFNFCISWKLVTQIQPWPTVIEGVFATLVMDVCFNVCSDTFFQFGKAFFDLQYSLFFSYICLDGLWGWFSIIAWILSLISVSARRFPFSSSLKESLNL